MKTIDLHTQDCQSSMDFVEALKQAIGASSGHGDGIDAFVDSMLFHDDMNTLKAPYTIVIKGLKLAGPEAQAYARTTVAAIEKQGAADWGTDLEIRMRIES